MCSTFQNGTKNKEYGKELIYLYQNEKFWWDIFSTTAQEVQISQDSVNS